jgi:putative ABC transport system permease protein
MNLVLAFRRLRQQPGFSAAVVATLALGLGATTAIFSVASAVLLRPLPYPEADALVMIEGHYLKLGMDNLGASAPELPDYRSARSFEGVAAFRNLDLNLAGGGEPERVSGAQVSASLFPLLGVAPQLGRHLRPEEEEQEADAVVVLSDGLWRRRFGADRAVVGRPVHLDGRSCLVVGVMPPGFEFPHPSFRFGRRADLWVPLALTPEQRHDRSTYSLRVIARLRAGVSLAMAGAEMEAVGRRLEEQHPGDYRGPRGEDGGWRVTVVPFKDEVVGDAGRRLRVLLGAVGVLLLIACANVAGLFLARGLARRRDFATRLALGARPSHLAREALAESVLLALLGGALGLLLASWGTGLLVALGPASVPRLAEVSLDGRVLAFASLLSLATGLAFSLVAPLAAAGTSLRESLGPGAAPSSRRGPGRSRQVLVVAQQALALVLLVDAGLVLQSLYHLQTVDSGFAAGSRLALEIALPPSRYPEGRQQAEFFERLLARVAVLPGVGEAGLVTRLPLTGPGFGGPFSIEGRPLDTAGPPPSVSYRAASARYLETMRIPLRRGRFLAAEDAPPAPPAAVVNETMVRSFFPGEEVLGRRLKLGAPGSPRPWLTVVGVVGDASDRGPGSVPRPEIYVPYPHQPASAMTLVVRAQCDPRLLAGALRAAVRAEDPEQAIASVRTLEEVRAESVAPQSFAAVLLAGFALLALSLTAVGVYGVASYVAGQRTRELGIRLALGAGRRELLGLLVSQSLVLALAGAGLGLAGALASTRALGSLLAGVAPTDPPTLVAGALGLVAIVVLAAYLPARRASRREPMWALRRE